MSPREATRRRQLESRLRYRAGRDPLLKAITRAAADCGVPVWLVGGAVRDAALGRTTADVDLAAGRPAARLAGALESVWRRRGYRFRRRSVTTWRFAVEGRTVDVVDAGTRGIERDLWRRELTVNAIAFDLLERRLLDPTGGLADLRARRLRVTREGVMREDPLRALRLARFLAALPAFRAHRETARLATAVAPRLSRAAAERIGDELDRLLEASDPVRGLEALERLGLLGPVLPELAPLRECAAGLERPNVWRHTLDAIGESIPPGRLPAGPAIAEAESRLVLRWSLLLHDVSKPETLAYAADGRPTFHGHEVLGARRAERLLTRLRRPRELRRRVHQLVRHHLRPSLLAEAGAPERGLRRLVRHAGADLPLLVLHAACDARASGSPDARGRWRRLRAVLRRLLELHRGPLGRPLPRLVTGRDVIDRLGIEPGPGVGRMLREIEERQVSGELVTRADALRFLDAASREVRSRRDRRPAP